MLKNRVVLVTGANAGIGFAIAEACRDAGASVMVHALDLADAESAASRLGDTAGAVAGDLTKPETPEALIEATVDRFGRLDGLVNNAAVLTRSTLEQMTRAHFDEMLAVNSQAPLFLIQAALPHLEAAGGRGSVVNIGSINALCGAADLLTYSASKAALQTATRNLGDTLGSRGVRVNQINVGWTHTENEHGLQLAAGRPEDWHENVPADLAPRGRILQPPEIAAHAVFWLSEASAPANGQVYELEQYPLVGRSPFR